MVILKVTLKFRCFKIICVVFVLMYICITTSEDVPGDDEMRLATCGVCYSVKALEDALNLEKFKFNKKAKYLLSAFEQYVKPKLANLTQNRTYPFITIEGDIISTRTFLAKKLAASMGALRVLNIPPVTFEYRSYFQNEIELKRLYFALNTYITSFSIQEMLQKSPVVLEGYWTNQATFYLAVVFEDALPPPDSNIYQFPEDLIAPDITIYFNCHKYEEDSNLARRNKKINECYRRIRGAAIYETNLSQSSYILDTHISEFREVIRERLAPKFAHLNL